MENDTLTLEVLRGIQSALTGVREDLTGVREDLTGVRGDLAGANLRLDRLERTTEELVRHQVATREAIDLLRTQAVMAGHALTAQMEGRLRLDDRVDNLERRVDALEREDG